MEILYKGKEQDWANETTIYKFKVNGKKYCLAHQNGDLTLLECDGEELRLDRRATTNRKIIRALVAHLNKMMRKINPNIKPIQSWPSH